jgi:hypothetical protein
MEESEKVMDDLIDWRCGDLFQFEEEQQGTKHKQPVQALQVSILKMRLLNAVSFILPFGGKKIYLIRITQKLLHHINVNLIRASHAKFDQNNLMKFIYNFEYTKTTYSYR